MSFTVDTGQKFPDTKRISGFTFRDARIDFTNRAQHAERFHRQIIENIEAQEDVDELDRYVADEDQIIDALFLAYPEYAAAIQTAHEEHRAILKAGAECERRLTAKSGPAEPGTQPAQSPNIGKSAKSGDEYDFFD